MSAMHFKKSYTWLWDSHISPKNSQLLSENLSEIDKQVKEMMRLINEPWDSDHRNQSSLVSSVLNFYRMYQTLAERYDDLTGALRKDFPPMVFPSEGSSSPSEHDSETRSPQFLELDSDQKTLLPPLPPLETKSSGFDIYRKGSDVSLSSLETGSDTDDVKEDSGNVFHAASSIKMSDLEAELSFTKEQLYAAHAEIDALKDSVEERSRSSDSAEQDGRHEVLINELFGNNNEIENLKRELEAKTEEFKAELALRDLDIEKCKLELSAVSEKFSHEKEMLEAEIGKLQEVVLILEGEVGHISQEKLLLEARVEELEEVSANFDSSVSEVSELQFVISGMTVKLEDALQKGQLLEARIAELEQADALQLQEGIDSLNAELERVLTQKLVLEARVEELEKIACDVKASFAAASEKFSTEKLSLIAKVNNMSQENASLEGKLAYMHDQTEKLMAEKAEVSLYVCELSRNIAELNIQLETLASEKEMLDKEVSDFKTVASQLRDLHLERDKLIADAESAQRVVIQLQARVDEQQNEIECQKAVIADSAEGKREAIRQLCYSLEHYRDGYKHLRQLLLDHKRLLVMAT